MDRNLRLEATARHGGLGTRRQRVEAQNLRSRRAAHACLLLNLAICLSATAQLINTRFIDKINMQPRGPLHDFRIGLTEVTQDEFVAFLNDALLSLEDERGAYMYFDLDTGDVYIAPTALGQTGENGSGTLLFDASVNFDRLVYDPSLGAYRIADSAIARHPVTGVTWYGALKLCNWLTVSTGLPQGQRCYVESANGAEWRPITISAADWSTRDLNGAERDALLQFFGYRLPSDGGVGESSPGVHNEWYKAAAWDGGMGTNHRYGFGRETLTAADANYRDSGDPFDNGTTPVGYFDGTNHGGAFQTTAEANAYGLRDTSGNVWEWMQDKDSSNAQRRNRGGGFQSAGSALETARSAARSASSANSSTGLRIAQAVPSPLFLAPEDDLVQSGIWGGPYDEGTSRFVCTLFNFSGTQVDFTASVDRGWLLVQPAAGSLAENAQAPVELLLDPHCTDGLEIGENTASVVVTLLQDGRELHRSVRLLVREPISLSPSGEMVAATVYGRVPAPSGFDCTASNASDLPVEGSAGWVETSGNSGGVLWLELNGEQAPNLHLDEHADLALRVAFTSEAASLPAGSYAGEVTLTDACTGAAIINPVRLEVTSPFGVEPEGESGFSGPPGGPFAPAEHTFTVTNLSEEPLGWSAVIEPPDATWILLDSSSGTIEEPRGTATILAQLTDEARNLPPGRHSVTLLWGEAGSDYAEAREVFVEVDGLRIEPVDDYACSGNEGGPFSPPSRSYTLFNHGVEELYWTASFEDTSDPPTGLTWIDVAPTDGVILDPDGAQDIVATLSADARKLLAGSYSGTLTFQADGLPPVAREVSLVVSRPSLLIQPEDDWAAGGSPGGPIHVRSRLFTIQNPPESRGPLDWSVALEDPLNSWLLLNGGSEDRGTLEVGKRARIVAAIDPAGTMDLPTGQPVEAVIVFSDLSAHETFRRNLTLTLSQPLVHLAESVVDPTVRQGGGPQHGYVMGRTHVTNAEFAAFLNDARANKSTLRGQYLYHDIDSGNVFLHSEIEGAEGSEGSGIDVYRRLKNGVQVGRILFDGISYAVDPGFETHPVTAVSWYGALKYCNWLSLDQGVPPNHRCYSEAPSSRPEGWHPASISDADWAIRDLNDVEQSELLRSFLGYRLPMDDGADRDCASAGVDSARLFNEWYAAAAWNPDFRRNLAYGFGRDAIDGLDANYRASGDPYESQVIPTTPGGRFDGTDWGDGFLPRADANAFGLYDMSGNVFRWLSSRYCLDRLNSRTLRGGAHDSARGGNDVSPLKTTSRTFASPGYVGAQVGFGIARSTAHHDGDADRDLDLDLDDWLHFSVLMDGPEQWVGFDAAPADLDADGDVDLADAARLLQRFGTRP